MKGLRVGITVGLRDASESLWNSGIKQNAIFLADALRRCPNVASTVLVNTTDMPLSSPLPWDRTRWPAANFEEVKDSLDVMIELGGQLDAVRTDYLKCRGVHLVSYCCGSEYIQTVEAMLFNAHDPSGMRFFNRRYDDIWLIPQVEHINRPYFEVLRRQTARVVPFVWSPVFLEQSIAGRCDLGQYQPRAGARRLTVMEPNLNVVKSCLYPALIAELAYRDRPDDIELLQVTNADHMATTNPEFITHMMQLDLVRDHKAVFLGRFDTPTFLAERTDVVISHQWENPLNYFYLEVCWQGYPLVHNATLCQDLGYFYNGHNLTEGARKLIGVIDTHDSHWLSYREHQRRLIDRYLPQNAALVGTYANLLDDLVRRPLR